MQLPSVTCRMGDEEMFVLSPKRNAENAVKRADALRLMIAAGDVLQMANASVRPYRSGRFLSSAWL